MNIYLYLQTPVGSGNIWVRQPLESFPLEIGQGLVNYLGF